LILDAYKATTESDSSESSGNSQHDIEACELLREINFGVLEGLPRGASVEEGLRVRAERLGMRIEEVRDHREAPHDVEQRHVSLLYLIAARALHAARVKTSAPPTARHVKVLCVSHGGFIRSFVTKRIGVHCESVPNCSFTEVEVGIGASGEVVSLRLLRLNDATHIPADI
jgi:broad specificity phosphatase PhoE